MADPVKKSLYDVALDGQGYVLVGDPTNPRIKAEQQPVFGNRFAQGDRDFQDLSFWWYQAIRDFSSGIKELNIFEDDGKFYYGRDLNTFAIPGEASSLQAMSAIKDFGTTDYVAVNAGDFDIISGTEMILQGVQGASGSKKSIITKSTNGTTFADVTNASSPTDGKAWKHIKKLRIFNKFYIARNDSSWAMSTYDGTTHTDVTATIQGADSLTVAEGYAEAGGRAWAFFRDGSSPVALIIKSSISEATWTTRVTISGAYWQGACEIGGDLVYVIDYGFGVVELRRYDVVNDADSLVHRWLSRSITLGSAREVRGGAIKTMDNQNAYIIFDGGEIWKYDGTDVTRVFRNVASQIPSTPGFGLILHEERLYGPNVVIAPDGSIHAGHYTPASGVAQAVWPMYSSKFTSDSVAYLYTRDNGTAATKVKVNRQDAGGSSLLELNALDGSVPNVDKLWNEITVLTDPLTANQQITLQYKLGTETSYTTVETIDYDTVGAVASYSFKLADNLISKKISIRLLLINQGTHAQRLRLKAVIAKFLPVPHNRYRWTFTLNCADRILLKDGSTMETKGAEHLRNVLRNSWWKRQVVSFEDLDGETLTLNGAHTRSATTISLSDNTDNLSEIGRVKIGDEEIQYTGKGKTSLTGCTRGARGTNAAAHSGGDGVSTAYDAVIVGYSEEVPISNQPNKREYRVTLTLLEV